jgi:anaphase-promoting complex subunit 10
LTLHFFKLVSIVKLRVYLDFKLDESYTPTRMKFFAGMSEGGLVEFGHWEVEDSADPETGEMSTNVEKIRGWIEIPLKGVGGRDPSYYEAQEARRARAYEKKIQHQLGGGASLMDVEDDGDEEDDLVGGDVLRAMVVQVRICENHQNGKYTHVRGFQVFAKDETSAKEMRKLVKRTKPRAKIGRVAADLDEEEIVGLHPAEWMGEPEIR